MKKPKQTIVKSTDMADELLTLRYNYYLQKRYFPNVIFCSPKQLNLIDKLHIVYEGYYADLAIVIDENLRNYDMIAWFYGSSIDINKLINKTNEYRIRRLNDRIF